MFHIPTSQKQSLATIFPSKKSNQKHHWGMFRWMFLFEDVAIHGFFHDHLCHLRKVRTSSKRTEICFGGWEVRGRFFSGAKRYIYMYIYIFFFFEHNMLNLCRKSPDFFRSLRVCLMNGVNLQENGAFPCDVLIPRNDEESHIKHWVPTKPHRKRTPPTKSPSGRNWERWLPAVVFDGGFAGW